MTDQRAEIEVWSEAPMMDVGSPMPAIAFRDDQLFVAYLLGQPIAPNDNLYAVVRFDGVLQYTFGYPNDEAISGHPLYEVGLQAYRFNEVRHSPYVKELGRRNLETHPDSKHPFEDSRHWVVSFHDETLEVVGRSITLVGTAPATSAAEAISLLPKQAAAADGAALRSHARRG